MNAGNESSSRWYEGITRYQWLVLAIACLGWTFDVFEGQIYAVYKTPAMADLLAGEDKAFVDLIANVGLASFLIGGTVGGLVFGVLADRIGRRQTMVWSILMYSVFTGLHYFATDAWHVVVLRFFGGLTTAETAAALGTSVSSVGRRWRFCRSWLRKRMGSEPVDTPAP